MVSCVYLEQIVDLTVICIWAMLLHILKWFRPQEISRKMVPTLFCEWLELGLRDAAALGLEDGERVDLQ